MDSNQNLFTPDQIILKTSIFGGFEKKDVLNYIDSLRESNRQGVEAVEEKIKEMSTAREELQSKVTDFQGQVSQLERQLVKKSDEISALTGTVDSLKDRVKEEKAASLEKDVTISRQKTQYNELFNQIEAAEQKAKRYEEISNQVGDIIIAAQKSADKSLKQAKAAAEEIQESAYISANMAYLEIQGIKEDMSTFKESMELMMKSLNTHFATIDQTVAAMERKVPQKVGTEKELTREISEEEPAVTISASKAYDGEYSKAVLTHRNAIKVTRPAPKSNTVLTNTIKNLFDPKSW